MNDITKPYKVRILKFFESVHTFLSYINVYLLPERSVGVGYHEDNWTAQDTYFLKENIFKAIQYGLPTVMKDNINDKDTHCRFMDPEDWIDLINIIDINDDR